MQKAGTLLRLQGRNDMQKAGTLLRLQGRNDGQKAGTLQRVQERTAGKRPGHCRAKPTACRRNKIQQEMIMTILT